MKKLLEKIKRKPDLIFYSVAGFVVVSFILTILIDGLNIFGVKNGMIQFLDIPYFWYHWYDIPFEIPIQWYILSLVLLVFAMNAGMALARDDNRVFSFWLLISLGLILMVVEDAGDVRHHLRFELENLTGEGPMGFFGTIWELLYFAVLGAVMAYAILGYRKVYWNDMKIRNYFLAGLIFYGIAVSSSWLGSAFHSEIDFELYTLAGEFIMTRMFVNGGVTEKAYELATANHEWFNFDFMDLVYEESLELLGAGSLLTAGVYFMKKYKKIPEQNNSSGEGDETENL